MIVVVDKTKYRTTCAQHNGGVRWRRYHPKYPAGESAPNTERRLNYYNTLQTITIYSLLGEYNNNPIYNIA